MINNKFMIFLNGGEKAVVQFPRVYVHFGRQFKRESMNKQLITKLKVLFQHLDKG